MATDRQQLLELSIGEPLEAWVRSRRDAGMSWRRIERQLYSLTDIELTWETLRTWYPDVKVAV